jgi:hypothetical protein
MGEPLSREDVAAMIANAVAAALGQHARGVGNEKLHHPRYSNTILRIHGGELLIGYSTAYTEPPLSFPADLSQPSRHYTSDAPAYIPSPLNPPLSIWYYRERLNR